ncbi:MAG: hypothetical protein KDH09_03950 [Chrysiogenetes bacterium]|nr:hypothetical protein [Chrysiogenetes bacterium]
MTKPDIDSELLRIVESDLSYIAACTKDGILSDDMLRRLSVPLRQLFIDDYFIRAWRTLSLEPKQPRIVGIFLQTEHLTPSTVAYAAGTKMHGIVVGMMSITYGPSSGEDKPTPSPQFNDMEHEFTLSDYLRSTAIYYHGTCIQRRQIIQYIANKKGGAHLDHKRAEDDHAYKILDEGLQTVILNRDSVFSLLLSIGQAISEAPDTKRLISEIKAYLTSR